jgi:hypothetical protein
MSGFFFISLMVPITGCWGGRLALQVTEGCSWAHHLYIKMAVSWTTKLALSSADEGMWYMKE